MWWLIGGVVAAFVCLTTILARRGATMEGFDHHDKGAKFERDVLERVRLRRSKKD
mgnify:FL=1